MLAVVCAAGLVGTAVAERITVGNQPYMLDDVNDQGNMQSALNVNAIAKTFFNTNKTPGEAKQVIRGKVFNRSHKVQTYKDFAFTIQAEGVLLTADASKTRYRVGSQGRAKLLAKGSVDPVN